MPSTGPPRAARAATAPASPRSRSQARSATVARLPGRITRSASVISAGEVTNRSATPGSAASGSVSVKLLIRGSRITATRSTSPPASPSPFTGPRGGWSSGPAPRLSESSASSHSPAVHGSTPRTGRPVRSRSRSRPGCSSRASPRNLFTANPATSAWSSRLSRASVPYRAASAPPRSMSATTITGRPAARARPMLARSCSRRLISAGLPAPSQMTASNRSASPVRQASTVPARRGFSAG